MLDIRYARSGDVSIAYTTVGDGPVDLVYVLGAFSHLEVMWELPAFRRYCERLAEFSRVLLFDKRGMGMSERVPGAVPLETRMDDIRAVMDAAGSDRAAIMGESEGGPLGLLFAAAHPERTTALVLQGSELRERTDEDWPWGESTSQEFEAVMASVPERWGSGGAMEYLAPSVGDQPWAGAWMGRLQLNSATPGGAEGFMRMAFEIDVRSIVPAVRVPALVIHAVDDRICHVENGRFLASTLPDARYVELPGSDHVRWFDPDRAIAEISEFLTGRREGPATDRVLAAILFTDIVDSTRVAAEMGDRVWRELLQAHYVTAGRDVARFGGTEVTTTGDGLLAVFDGPARAIRCAMAVIESARELGIDVRTGVHAGEVEKIGANVAGLAVHIASRVASLAGAGEVWVSGTVRDLVVGSGFSFTDQGTRSLKGVPGDWRVSSVDV